MFIYKFVFSIRFFTYMDKNNFFLSVYSAANIRLISCSSPNIFVFKITYNIKTICNSPPSCTPVRDPVIDFSSENENNVFVSSVETVLRIAHPLIPNSSKYFGFIPSVYLFRHHRLSKFVLHRRWAN